MCDVARSPAVGEHHAQVAAPSGIPGGATAGAEVPAEGSGHYGLPFRPGRHGHDHSADQDGLSGTEIDEGEDPDRFSIVSVGVDIGSATSHLLVSRLTMRRLGKSMMSRYVVVGRETLYRSRVSLTPYRRDGLIDAESLRRYVASCYEESGIAHDDIDTGVVLLTGEALRRENSRAIASLLSDASGRFVCASAGHHLESRVAAHGAGTVQRARQTGERLLNVDVGGGTAKLALIDGGEIVATGAVNVGCRLIATDSDGLVSRVEPAGRWAAAEEGVALREGVRVEEGELERIAARLADCLADVLSETEPLSPLAERLLLTGRVYGTSSADGVVISGGVSEYLRRDDAPGFGDLGRALALRIGERLAKLYGNRVSLSTAGLRATVVGLSQFTVEASGDTIFLSAPSPLPIRNIPLIKARVPDEPGGFDLEGALAGALKKRDVQAGDHVGVFLDWSGIPRYPALGALATGLGRFFRGHLDAAHPAVVVIAQDCARGLGHLLHRELGHDARVVCIDGLDLGEFDYIDIGSTVPGKSVVPVVIKSLLFPGETT